MLSLNQIKIKLKDHFNQHAQIASVYSDKNFDFAAEKYINYPTANIEFISANVSNRTLNYSFKIVLADLTNGDKDLEDSVESDLLLISEDFFAFLQQTEGLFFDKSTSLIKFNDDKGDRTSGFVFTINLGVIRSQNECATPVVKPVLIGGNVINQSIALNAYDVLCISGDYILTNSSLDILSSSLLFVDGDLILNDSSIINDGSLVVAGNTFFNGNSSIKGIGVMGSNLIKENVTYGPADNITINGDYILSDSTLKLLRGAKLTVTGNLILHNIILENDGAITVGNSTFLAGETVVTGIGTMI